MEPVNSEKLGETCMDGGTCHHKESCTERCFRRQFCSPLTLAVDAGLTMDKWRYPDDPAKAPGGPATGISLSGQGVGSQEGFSAPIDMVLHCPSCGLQHIDEPEQSVDVDGYSPRIDWGNPPHRSHLCHGCGHIWRPADVPTNGVKAVQTRGKADSPVIGNPISGGITDTQVEAATMALVGFGTDPAPGTDWFACRSWRINKVRSLMRKALEAAARTK